MHRRLKKSKDNSGNQSWQTRLRCASLVANLILSINLMGIFVFMVVSSHLIPRTEGPHPGPHNSTFKWGNLVETPFQPRHMTGRTPTSASTVKHL